MLEKLTSADLSSDCDSESRVIPEPKIIPRPEHPISRANIDVEVLKVLYRLHHKGYKAYLVGGSVRDLWLGKKPKDFDIATDASPQDIRRLRPVFVSNCLNNKANPLIIRIKILQNIFIENKNR